MGIAEAALPSLLAWELLLRGTIPVLGLRERSGLVMPEGFLLPGALESLLWEQEQYRAAGTAPPDTAGHPQQGIENFILNSISSGCLKTTHFSFHWQEERWN